MGWLVLTLWPLALLAILSGDEAVQALGVGLLAGYLALAISAMPWSNRLLCALLSVATLGIALADDELPQIAEAAAGSLVFMAFVPTAHLLRNVARQEPRVLAFRDRFRDAPEDERPAWILIGAHVLGSVLTIGALAVLSPIMSSAASGAARRAGALAAVAGAALACVWSPFFVALAFVSSFLPAVPLWQPILLGLALAALGLGLALAMMNMAQPARIVWDALASLAGFLPLVLVAGLSVVALRTTTTLSTLEAACLALPPLCLLLILTRRRSRAETAFGLRRIVLKTRGEFGDLGGEIGVVTLAFILGVTMRESAGVDLAVAALGLSQLPGVFVMAAVAFGMAGAAMLSVHPIVSASILLAVFADANQGVSDLALMGAALLGWSSAAMLAYSGLMVIVATGMFDVRRSDLVLGRNMVIALAYVALGTLGLTVLNAILI